MNQCDLLDEWTSELPNRILNVKVVGFGDQSRRYMRYILSEWLDMVKVSFH